MRISDWSSDVCSSDLREHPKLSQLFFHIALSNLNSGNAASTWQDQAALRQEQARIQACRDLSFIHHLLTGQKHERSHHHWRSEERRVGNECVRTCNSRWSTSH